MFVTFIQRVRALQWALCITEHRTLHPPASASGDPVNTPHPSMWGSCPSLFSRPWQLPLAQAPGPVGWGESHAPVPPHYPQGDQALRQGAVGGSAHLFDAHLGLGEAQGLGRAGHGVCWTSAVTSQELQRSLPFRSCHTPAASHPVSQVSGVWRGSLCLTGSVWAQTSPACDLCTPADCCPCSHSVPPSELDSPTRCGRRQGSWLIGLLRKQWALCQ